MNKDPDGTSTAPLPKPEGGGGGGYGSPPEGGRGSHSRKPGGETGSSNTSATFRQAEVHRSGTSQSGPGGVSSTPVGVGTTGDEATYSAGVAFNFGGAVIGPGAAISGELSGVVGLVYKGRILSGVYVTGSASVLATPKAGGLAYSFGPGVGYGKGTHGFLSTSSTPTKLVAFGPISGNWNDSGGTGGLQKLEKLRAGGFGAGYAEGTQQSLNATVDTYAIGQAVKHFLTGLVAPAALRAERIESELYRRYTFP